MCTPFIPSGTFTYQEKDLTGGWSMNVIRNGVLVGHIRKSGLGNGYAYFHGPSNFMTARLEAANLDDLKSKIEGETALT
jgi:hypothetical protein